MRLHKRHGQGEADSMWTMIGQAKLTPVQSGTEAGQRRDRQRGHLRHNAMLEASEDRVRKERVKTSEVFVECEDIDSDAALDEIPEGAAGPLTVSLLEVDDAHMSEAEFGYDA